MHYPAELLPCPDRKLIEESLSDFYLIRYFDVFEGHEVENSENQINEIYIFGESNGSSRRIIDLSTILHGVFKQEHIKIQLTQDGGNEYGGYCEPDCVVEPPKIDEHFIINNDIRFWAVKISDIENQKIKYHNVNTKQDFYAECRIIHTPKKANFWHYSIDWEVEEGLFRNLKKENRGFEKKAKRYGNSCKVLLKKHIVLDCPAEMEIPEKYYLK